MIFETSLSQKVTSALVAAIVVAGVTAASAQGNRNRGIPVSRSAGDLTAYLKAKPGDSDDWIRIDVADPNIPVGTQIAVCTQAQSDGYLSVWSRTLDGEPPVRVYPNDFTPEERAQKGGPVLAGQEVCLGDGTAGYNLVISPPFAPAEIYLHWSATLSGQFGPEDMPMIPDPGERAVSAVAAGQTNPSGGAGTPGNYSSRVLGYTVSQ